MSRYTVHTSSIQALGKTRSDLDLLAGALLTARIGLTGQVILHHRHALALPFPDGTFGGTLFAQVLPRPLSQRSDGLGHLVLLRRSRKRV